MTQTDMSKLLVVVELTEQAIVLQKNGWNREASQVLSKARRIAKRADMLEDQSSNNFTLG